MKIFTQQVITPKYEKSGWCMYCGHKLSFRDRYRKRRNEKIVCSYCGENLQGDIVVIDGKKIPRDMMIKW